LDGVHVPVGPLDQLRQRRWIGFWGERHGEPAHRNATGGARNPVCAAGQSAGEVQTPVFRMNLAGQTGWFASPVVADLDGDGQVEIFVQSFDHGMDISTVPGSAGNCLCWPTARGGPLRMGQPNDNGL
jgi:hypothetical protein